MISMSHNEFVSYSTHITYIVHPIPPLDFAKHTLQKQHNQQQLKSTSNTPKLSNDHQQLSQTIESNKQTSLYQNQDTLHLTTKKTKKQEKQPKLKGQKKKHVQKYGRNICSNIFHSIIKKVLYQKKYNKIIKGIIQKYEMQITQDQFYNKLYFKQNKLNEYVAFAKIAQFYMGDKNKIKEGAKRHQQFCKIFRIITRIYLHKQHAPITFDCQKLRPQSKKFHIRESKKLFSIIDGSFKHCHK